MITYSAALYEWLRPLLDTIDRMRLPTAENKAAAEPEPADVILFGLGRFGARLYRRLEDDGYKVLAIDLDPGAVRRWRAQGYRVRYGDVTDQDFWTDLPLATARWIVLAVPFGTIRLTEADPASGLLAAIRTHRFQGRVALTAREKEQARELSRAGVDLVLTPFDDAAMCAADQILAMDEEARKIREEESA